jgi:peptide/nickel transport system substrate-binding protein
MTARWTSTKRTLLASAALALTMSAASAETLRWARVGDALTLDPHSQNEGPTSTMLHHIYETLVERAIDGSLTPRLATNWYIDPEDPTVWVFELREGVTFHDGSAFTAEDVVFSLERVRTEASDFKALHASVVGAEAVDDYTVRVQMEGPTPLYPQNLTNFFIMDRDWAVANDVELPQDTAAGEETFAVRNTNGTGPYTLVSRDPEVRTVLAVYEDHWDEAPEVTEIIYTPITEAATRVAALLSGEVDFVQDVPVQDIARLEETDGITVTTGAENRTIFFAYDMGSEDLMSASVDGNPFANPLVREAMHLSLDRDAIQRVVMRGQSVPGAQNVPPFDSQYVFDFLVHSTEGARGGWNGSRYSNPEIDAKIQSLATETDLEVRNATIAEIWQQIQEDRVFLMVHNQLLAYAAREGVNIEVHPENQPRMTTVTFD